MQPSNQTGFNCGRKGAETFLGIFVEIVYSDLGLEISTLQPCLLVCLFSRVEQKCYFLIKRLTLLFVWWFKSMELRCQL